MAQTVLKTDGDFRSTVHERKILEQVGIKFIEAQCQTPDDIVEHAENIQADALIVLKAPVTRDVINRLPAIKVISRYGIGVDMIDVGAATELGVPVVNVPDYCVDEVATHTIALALSLWRKILLFNDLAVAGSWTVEPARPIYRLAGRTLGLVGFGRLAQRVRHKLTGWDMRVMAYDPFAIDEVFQDYRVERAVTLNDLLRQSDIVSLHLPLNESTKKIIGAAELATMKPTALLINTARGELVDEGALSDVLANNGIGGAALDVLSTEPPNKGNKLLRMENVVLSPHVAYYSEEALAQVQTHTASAVVDVLSGRRPLNLVNPQVWEHRRQ